MLDHLRGLSIFVKVAQTGSFSAAARALRLTPSVVSHHVTQLEDRLGVPLLYRSTRSLSLTAEGHNIFPSALAMIAAAEEALDAVSLSGDALTGQLKVAMPAFGADGQLGRLIWQFAGANPAIQLTVNHSDWQSDMIRGGYDLAIRLGTLRDSTLKTRRLGKFERKLVASPGYLAEIGPITAPGDLRRCAFVGLDMLPDTIMLRRGEEEVEMVTNAGRIRVDGVASARSAVLAGLGLQRLPLSEVQDDLDTGRLIEILPDWKPPVLGIYAVWPDSGPQRRLTRSLIDFLVEAMD